MSNRACSNCSHLAFEKGHCYEPYIQNGNFSTTDPTYGVGTVVQFTCDPGHSLEQGPPVIECINTRDPYWNDTEPLCKGIGLQYPTCYTTRITARQQLSFAKCHGTGRFEAN